MLRFFKCLVFVVFFQALFFLSAFYIENPSLYAPWVIVFILFLIVNIFCACKIFPSKKKKAFIKQSIQEYNDITQLEETTRLEALKMQFTCPKCSEANNYWSFLDNYKCKNCGSEAWSSQLSKQDTVHEQLFQNREQIFNYHKKTSAKTIKKIKSLKNSEFTK